ncbi:hypothetical protein CHLNCDRAFT_136825 [Chlorella variabilis]|uniref:Uncharacterized protein n=1 Tax=Chlorella variabilis TaxID=554065 RepID=E1ZL50_CHLVA|nr:hypothetical protein CHLNCDRAFT_136825 [Chlorella variabilis]EFN53598.1 hypothetical protein CHLNCDRAFT_136825 [Chlorella variabilis]|eukprot:XP_005845700.1 hypothetical protein CHLNCDRAFT_136825 [Chlorella variabilis]
MSQPTCGLASQAELQAALPPAGYANRQQDSQPGSLGRTKDAPSSSLVPLPLPRRLSAVLLGQQGSDDLQHRQQLEVLHRQQKEQQTCSARQLGSTPGTQPATFSRSEPPTSTTRPWQAAGRLHGRQPPQLPQPWLPPPGQAGAAGAGNSPRAASKVRRLHAAPAVAAGADSAGLLEQGWFFGGGSRGSAMPPPRPPPNAAPWLAGGWPAAAPAAKPAARVAAKAGRDGGGGGAGGGYQPRQQQQQQQQQHGTSKLKEQVKKLGRQLQSHALHLAQQQGPQSRGHSHVLQPGQEQGPRIEHAQQQGRRTPAPALSRHAESPVAAACARGQPAYGMLPPLEPAPALATAPAPAAAQHPAPAAAVPEACAAASPSPRPAAAPPSPPAAAYLTAYLACLPRGPQWSCALQLVHRLDGLRPSRLTPDDLAAWAAQQGFAAPDLREALVALQAAAVLELRQLPATSGPPCSGSACTAWQLLPAGAGLGLAERDVEAAVQAAEAAGAAAEVAAVGEELVAAVVAAAGQAAARMPVWLKGPRSPTSVALPFIRPGAAAMLRALLASPRRQLPTDALDAAAVAGALERAAGGGQRVPTSQLGMWCRQLLEASTLLDSRQAARSSRLWHIPPSRAAAAAAAVAGVLGQAAPEPGPLPALGAASSGSSDSDAEGAAPTEPATKAALLAVPAAARRKRPLGGSAGLPPRQRQKGAAEGEGAEDGSGVEDAGLAEVQPGGDGTGAAGSPPSLAPAPLLPPMEEAIDVLEAAAGDDAGLMPLALQLLAVAQWAGVEARKAAVFGEWFPEMLPPHRLLLYRKIAAAAGQQDAGRVRSLVLSALLAAPGGRG